MYIQKELLPSVKQATLWNNSTSVSRFYQYVKRKTGHSEKAISIDFLLQNSIFSPTIFPVGISLGVFRVLGEHRKNLVQFVTKTATNKSGHA